MIIRNHRRPGLGRWALLVGLAAVLLPGAVGCGPSSRPRFVLNMEGKKATEITRDTKQQIVTALEALFGTPDDPYVFPQSGLDLRKIRLAAGPYGGNEDGSQRGLYRQHCVHCHGVTGDGAGPTAAFLNPYPRDYRRGLYKFKSTERGSRPSFADLDRVIRQGVVGTAMPAFDLLPSDEVEALVEYVRYLSIRGEVETILFLDAEANDGQLEMNSDYLVSVLEPIAGMWKDADQSVVVPVDYPTDEFKHDLTAWKEMKWDETYPQAFAALERKDPQAWHVLGKEIFLGGKSQCTKCHGPTGLGDGSQGDQVLFDDWNKDKKLPGDDGFVPGLTWTLPKQVLQPRNLRMSWYRGGRSPADLYRRLYSGINGTPMPEGKTTLKPPEIWAIVDYIRTLPFDALSRTPHHHTAGLAKDRL